MASIRGLKKDIDFLFFELISDCFLATSIHEGEKKIEIQNLIEEAVVLRYEFIDRANHHPEGKDNPALVRAYYTNLRKDLSGKVNEYFEKLSSIAKQ